MERRMRWLTNRFPSALTILRNFSAGYRYVDKTDFINLEEEYQRHMEILPNIPTGADRLRFQRLAERRGTVQDYYTALFFLSGMLHRHYGQPAVILIDEYDVLLELKTARSYRDMDSLCDEAPVQIRTRRCVEGLQDEGCREALAYGICFYKKR